MQFHPRLPSPDALIRAVGEAAHRSPDAWQTNKRTFIPKSPNPEFVIRQ